MSQQQTIPILGIDTRPLRRQSVDGLCQTITNLRPDGAPESPYWTPVTTPKELTNASGVVFDHPKKTQIVASHFMYGHQQAGGGQQRRLVLIFSDGTLAAINPDGEQDWQVMASYRFGETRTDWQADFSPVDETLAIAISKGDQPFKLLYLYNDTIVPYGFPFLPSLLMEKIEVSQLDETKLDKGIYDGLDDGVYAYRYGFRLSNGDNVAVSPPIPFEVENKDEKTFHELEFTLAGYSAGSTPDNLPFWKDFFTGIDVFLSEKHDSKEDVLLNGLFYNVVSFGSVGASPDNQKNIKRYKGKYDQIPTNRVLEVDTEGNHGLAASTVHSYNSRLLLGAVAVDFVEPPLSIYGFVNPGVRVVMSPVEFTSAQYYARGSNYETYTVGRAEFTLTSLYDSVLPESAVSISAVTNGGTPSIGRGDSDQVVEVSILIYNGDPQGPYDPRGELSFDVDAQAYKTLDATTAAGDPFSFHYGPEEP